MAFGAMNSTCWRLSRIVPDQYQLSYDVVNIPDNQSYGRLTWSLDHVWVTCLKLIANDYTVGKIKINCWLYVTNSTQEDIFRLLNLFYTFDLTRGGKHIDTFVSMIRKAFTKRVLTKYTTSFLKTHELRFFFIHDRTSPWRFRPKFVTLATLS